MDKQKVYFSNLNGLRFIAAFLVIIHHIEQTKSIMKLDYFADVRFVWIIGKLGVILFFVLSGFLITYLLFVEESSRKDISVKNFYMRRVLRIWPLYFLIIALAFFVLPNISLFVIPQFEKGVLYTDLFTKLFLYLIFFPNLIAPIFGFIPYASHTWSIGAEEQFYLIWPVILKHIKKHRFILMCAIIIGHFTIGRFLATHHSDFIPYKYVLKDFWFSFNVSCMAIGAIYAILLFQKSKLLPFLLNNYLFYGTVALLIFLMVKGVYIPYIHYELYSVFFGIVILNLAANNNLKISLENRIFNYLGKISYGLYMYHSIAITLAVSLAIAIGVTSNLFIYPLSIGLTIAIAGLSYKYFESYFLKFKNKFSDVISGDENVDKQNQTVALADQKQATSRL